MGLILFILFGILIVLFLPYLDWLMFGQSFTCENCGKTFTPTFRQYSSSSYNSKKNQKLLRCPHCNTKTFAARNNV